MSKEPDWRAQLASIQQALVADGEDKSSRALCLLINTSASRGGSGLVLDVFAPRKGPNDDESRLQRASAEIEEIEELFGEAGNGAGRFAIVSALLPEPPRRKGRQSRGRRPAQSPGSLVRRLRLPSKLYERVLPHLCASESLGWWDGRSRNKLHLLWWDSGAPWRLSLRLDGSGQTTRLSGGLERDGEKAALSDPLLILPFRGDEDGASGSGLVLFDETIARLESSGGHDDRWLELLREEKEIVIPRMDLDEALSTLFEIPGLPTIEASEELQLEEASSDFEPRLMLEPDPAAVGSDPPLLATLSFCYGDLEASAEDPRPSIIDWPTRTFLRRDMEGEHEALVHLLETEVRPVASGHGHGLELSPHEVPSVAESLLAEGWIIEVRGTSLRSASPPALKVESGMDWFELSGSTDFRNNDGQQGNATAERKNY